MVAFRRSQNYTQKGPLPEKQICRRFIDYPYDRAEINITCHADMETTLAQYVYVYIEGMDNIMTMCELEVYEHTGQYNTEFHQSLFPMVQITIFQYWFRLRPQWVNQAVEMAMDSTTSSWI